MQSGFLLLFAVASVVGATSYDSDVDAGRVRRQYGGYTNVGYRSGSVAPGLGAGAFLQLKSCERLTDIPNGQARCGHSGCRIRCQPGYAFPSQSRSLMLRCDHSTGELMLGNHYWTADLHQCQPQCTGRCANGGTCNEQGTCTCAYPYTGDRCQDTQMVGDDPSARHRFQEQTRDPSERLIECTDGTKLPDGSTSVVLHHKEGHWYFPDGQRVLGLEQVTCQSDNNGRYEESRAPETEVVTSPPADLESPPVAQYTCTPPCRNGGECVYTNTCSCPRAYWGPRCQVKLCRYPRYRNNLHASLGGTLRVMKFECHHGYQTAQGTTVVTVLCINGEWKLPGGKPLQESDVTCHGTSGEE